MLNNNQINEYRRFKTLSDFFIRPTSVPVIATFPPFGSRVTLFQTHFNTLDGFVPKKDVDGKGITADKKTTKQTISDTLAIYCRKTRAFALTNNLAQLASDMNVTSTKINRINDADFEAFVNTKTALITLQIPNALFTPYGITQPLLDAVNASANTFNNQIGLADNVQSDASVANANINTSIHILENDILILDLLVEHFQVTNPDFFNGYHNNSVLQNLGVHHSGIEGTTSPGAIITSETKSVTPDLNNHFLLSRLTVGDHTITATLTGKAPITKVIKVTRGHVEHVDFIFS